MPYSVSSWFVDQCLSTKPSIKRKFMIGTSDYSERVIKWPSIVRKWDDLKSTSVTIGLHNQDQAMNFIRDTKTTMQTSCSVHFGFNTDSGTSETINMFSGVMGRVEYSGGNCNITMTDKFKQLEERVVGTSDVPVSYTASSYLPSDLAWYIVTSYGGFSAVTSTSNPDIDYAAFQTWSAIFSGDSVLMKGTFDGAKCSEIIRKIARHTFSGVFVKENKLSFVRFGPTNSNVASVGPNHLYDVSLSFDDEFIVNKQFCFGGYDTTSKYWTISTNAANSASVNSYGRREGLEKDENIWYTTSGSAINLAQRIITVKGLPYDQVNIKTGLTILPQLIGETIYVEDAFHSMQDSYRIMEQKFDMDKGELSARIDRSQLTTFFTLDVSSLDGSDTLS